MSGVGLINELFKGVRIVEVSQVILAPSASAVLCDLGAEVISVESVGSNSLRALKNDDDRQTASATLVMERSHRGKKSVAIDLKTEEGREFLLKLVETADIFLTSLRPAALERLSLTHDELRKRNRRLIYTRENGLGASAVTPRPSPGDHMGAMNVAFGLAAALFHRERTEIAPAIEVSLLSSARAIPEDLECSPRLGEHTQEVLRDLGIGLDYLKDCKAREVVFWSDK
jgi:crotonobetainyl-CoA:carnitine CoA-transferase CaiB-like acyl-CoA transferase